MATAKCRTALKNLLLYIENSDSNNTEVEAAMDHINTCPHCQHQIGYFVRALRDPDEDTLTCGECEDLLPEYLEAEKEGYSAGPRWSPVIRHLATCPHCDAVYKELAKISALAYREQSVDLPQRYSSPDLSFLNKKKETSLSSTPLWQLDDWGRLIIQFSADLIRTWQPPAYGMAGLKKGTPKILGQVSVELQANLEVIITIEEQRNDPTRCAITVKVNIPTRDLLNLGGTEVILKRGQESLTTQVTDSFGETVFEKIPLSDLPYLTFEIEPENQAK